MICKKCGAQIDDNSSDCKFCGAVFGSEEEMADTIVVDTDAVNDAVGGEPEESDIGSEIDALFDENEKKRRKHIDRMKAEKQQQLEEIEKRREEKRKREKRVKVIVVIAALLIACGAAAGVYYLSTPNSNDPDIIIATGKPTQSPMPTIAATAAPEESPSPVPTEAGENSWQPVNNGASASGSGASSASGRTSPASNGTSASSSGTSSGSGKASSSSSSAQSSSANTNSTSSASAPSVSKPANNQTYAAESAPNGSGGRGTVASTNKYAEVRVNSDGYVLLDSNSRELTTADLDGLTPEELKVARNEIYARHGRKFNDASLQEYFNACAWYKINDSYNYNNDASNLSKLEHRNAAFILKYEKAHR